MKHNKRTVLSFQANALNMLLNYLELQSLVLYATAKLLHYFGEEATVVLEKFDEGGDPLLFLEVCTDLSAQKAREALDRFHEEWWSTNVEGKATNILNVAVSFKKPGVDTEVMLDSDGYKTVKEELDRSPEPNEAMKRLFRRNT